MAATAAAPAIVWRKLFLVISYLLLYVPQWTSTSFLVDVLIQGCISIGIYEARKLTAISRELKPGLRPPGLLMVSKAGSSNGQRTLVAFANSATVKVRF